LLAIVWLAASSVQAATYYVATNGSDSNNGQSASQGSGSNGPWRTLQKAINTAGSGDTVYVRGGNYSQSCYVNRTWSTSNPLTFRRYNSEVPVLVTSSASPWYISGAAGLVVDGIDVAGINNYDAIIILNSHHITFRNCTIRNTQTYRALYAGNSYQITINANQFLDNGSWAIHFDQVNSSAITGNRFERTRANAAVSLTGSSTYSVYIGQNTFVDNYPSYAGSLGVISLNSCGAGNTVEGNSISNSSYPAPNGDVPLGQYCFAVAVTVCNNTVIRNNTIQNFAFRGTIDLRADNPSYIKYPSQGGMIGDGIKINGMSSSPVSSHTVAGNYIANCPGTGVNLQYVNNSTVSSNLIANCGEYGVLIAGTPGNHTMTVNNVVQDNEVYGVGWIHGGMSGISVFEVGTGNILRRNICYNNRQGTAGQVGYDWYLDGIGISVDKGSDGTVVENNICFGNEGPGIGVGDADNASILNNTIVGNGRCPHFYDREGLAISTVAGNCLAANNLIYNNRTVQLGVSSTGHTMHHNLMAQGPLTDTGKFGSYVIIYLDKFYTVPSWQVFWGSHVNADGDIGATPLFAGSLSDPDPANFALTDSSPGLAAGAALTSFQSRIGYLITYDLAGASRNLSTPTLGAIETTGENQHSVMYDFNYAGKWVYVEIIDYTAQQVLDIEGSGNQFGLTHLELPVSPGRWYQVRIWDYDTSSWVFSDWTCRF